MKSPFEGTGYLQPLRDLPPRVTVCPGLLFYVRRVTFPALVHLSRTLFVHRSPYRYFAIRALDELTGRVNWNLVDVYRSTVAANNDSSAL